MPDFNMDQVAHPQALKLVLVLAGVFVLVLLGVRLAELASLLQALSDRVPVLRVEPGIPGDCVLVAVLLAALPVFLLPRAWRIAAWGIMLIGGALLVGISGNLAMRGNSGIAHTPLASWLQSQGYSRCPAADRLHGNRRGDFVAEGWAQPDACPVSSGAPDPAP